MQVKWWVPLVIALLSHEAGATDQARRLEQRCTGASAKPVRDVRAAEAIAQAQMQHRLFGGQLINRSGGIVRIGFHEAEFDRPEGDSTPTWERVAQFWAALEPELPSTFRASTESRIDRHGLLGRIAGASGALPAGRLDERELAATASAFLRSALVDHPWSAAFISYVMRKSGFASHEFEFSDSHVDYVDKAVLASSAELEGAQTTYAFRACDIAVTRPRAGDLVCYTRERSGSIRDYASLTSELALRRARPQPTSFPMHCELVTRSDEGGDAKIESIGGNVFQSVTLRKMTLNARKTLTSAYFRVGSADECIPGRDCNANLSRNSWVVLLQLRN